MAMLGCRPKGRLTEQHDIFFGIGNSLAELIPNMKQFWPEAKGKIHIDAWQKVTFIDGFSVEVVDRCEEIATNEKLFFINLGGYKENEFEEYHYKVLTVAKNKAAAIKNSKKTTFFKHCGFEGAGASHIDDKFGIDVDDIYRVNDILSDDIKSKFQLKITKTENGIEDEKHIGYLKLDKKNTLNL
jgi:LysM repeat protein